MQYTCIPPPPLFAFNNKIQFNDFYLRARTEILLLEGRGGGIRNIQKFAIRLWYFIYKIKGSKIFRSGTVRRKKNLIKPNLT